MTTRLVLVFALACVIASAGVLAQQQPATDFKIVVLKGEGAVNIIQQKTAVAPLIEVRDRNNLPVPGVTVTFAVGSGPASFGGASTITATTNALGQATATGFAPSAAGAVHINVTAVVQGEKLAAAITQTNFATAAQAAQAGASAASGGGSGSSAAAAGGAAGGGGGISAMTIGIIGAAAGGAAVVATQTDIFGGNDGFIRLLGQVYANIQFGLTAATCPGVLETIGTGTSCYTQPVTGATVSTTLDSATATTDTAGNFDLTTTLPRSKINDCISYTITIRAAGLPTYTLSTSGFSGNKQGNEHRQIFALSPPTPSFMGGC